VAADLVLFLKDSWKDAHPYLGGNRLVCDRREARRLSDFNCVVSAARSRGGSETMHLAWQFVWDATPHLAATVNSPQIPHRAQANPSSALISSSSSDRAYI
jgi:hypothetical protein